MIKRALLVLAVLLCVSCSTDINVQDVEKLNTIKGVSRIYISNWSGDEWKVDVDVEGKCGSTTLKSSSTSLSEAIKEVTRQVECIKQIQKGE